MVNFNEGFSKYPSLPVSLFIGKARGRYTFYFSFRTFGHINRIVLQFNKARRAKTRKLDAHVRLTAPIGETLQ